MKTQEQQWIERLRAWEETARTEQPALCIKHADGIIRELRQKCEQMYPEALAKHDAEKTPN